MTQVNAGAAAIIKLFLSDEAATKHEQKDREKLADLVVDFFKTLALGLKLNKSFMDPTADQLVLHEELEKGYERFDQLLNSCSIFKSVCPSRYSQGNGSQTQENLKSHSRKLTSFSILEKG